MSAFCEPPEKQGKKRALKGREANVLQPLQGSSPYREDRGSEKTLTPGYILTRLRR